MPGKQRSETKSNGFKHNLDIVKAIFEILAIGIAGLWALKIYDQQREGFPHAILEVTAQAYRIGKELMLVQAKVKVKNSGKTMITTDIPTIYMQQVSPPLSCAGPENCPWPQIGSALSNYEQNRERFSWPTIADFVVDPSATRSRGMRLEPGETLARDFEFVVRGDAKLLRLYASIHNDVSEREEVWDDAIIVEVSPENLSN